MKRPSIFLLSYVIIICFTKCNYKSSQDPNKNNPDSVKKIIIALNDEIYSAYSNPEKFRSYCEDSMLVVGKDHFFKSSIAFSNDLPSHFLVPPHDYTFSIVRQYSGA